jgi:hypothetical protein
MDYQYANSLLGSYRLELPGKEIGMGKTLGEMISQLPKERQGEIEAGAADLQKFWALR